MNQRIRKAAAMFLCLALFISMAPHGAALATESPIVTFDTHGGSPVEPAVAENGAVNMPATPEREGYIFAGWYTTETPQGDGRGEAPATAGGGFFGPVQFVGITADATVHARWIKDTADEPNVRYLTTADDGVAVTLGYSLYSGLTFLDENAQPVDPAAYVSSGSNPIFKDLNRNGKVDAYEDWRLSYVERSADLAAQLKADPDGVQQIAGLMLYSGHQTSWTSSAPTQDQVTFLINDDLRHVLIASSAPAGQMGIHADWNNNVQSIVEGMGYGIPANNSSDPRHGTSSGSNVEYYSANAGVSAWPSSLGMAATFNTDLNKLFGKIASIEYRAMGIATALSPQIDIATDPRWGRFSGTFGEDPKLASAMSQAYVDGFQTTYDDDADVTNDPAAGGWGTSSVNAMMKHWPGGGAGEGGRDAHYNFGKYAIYPGNNWEAHLIPFVDGSLSLQDGTGMASAVMPYYTISYMQTPGSESNEKADEDGSELNVANAYNEYMINGVLRDAYEFDGVVCTDWNVVGPAVTAGGFMFDGDLAGMIWGVDDHYPESQEIDLDGSYANMAERARLLLNAGVDQFGGLNTTAPIVKAYADATDADKLFLLEQLEDSAYRLLNNIFRTGLFENPYLVRAESEEVIGNPEYMKAGYDAQLQSMVLLKNESELLPLDTENTKVYAPASDEATIALLEAYFGEGSVSAESSDDADVAIVFMQSVSNGGGSRDQQNHVNNYTPINLDFADYTADQARSESFAGEPIRDESGEIIGIANRSYKGVTTSTQAAPDALAALFGPADTSNSVTAQLERLQAAYDSGKPVVVVFDTSNPSVLTQIEPKAAAILVSFQSQKSAVLDMLIGSTTYGDADGEPIAIVPTGMLPFQFPKDMETVETQYEDVPRDMEVYADALGNSYDFGYGLSWKDGQTVLVDETVNPGYTKFVSENQIPMSQPINKGDPTSDFNIRDRRSVTFDYGYKADEADAANKYLIKIVNLGSAVTNEAAPKREGYAFQGWYLDGEAYDFTAPIKEDITLTAQWLAE
jgi:uncharacterized repeat protein (TIGR02543 family)